MAIGERSDGARQLAGEEQRLATGLEEERRGAAQAVMVAPIQVVSRLRRVAYGTHSSAAVSKKSLAASVANGVDDRGWLELGRWM